MRLRAGVLVVSDRASAGEMEDRSGPEAARALASFADVEATAVVPDDVVPIREHLTRWCDEGIQVIFTLGGTGLSPRDVTPEATRAVLEREAPALITALVVNGLRTTSRAMLSRAVAGQRGGTLIINLPGKPAAARESIEYLADVLPHAVEMMRGAGHPDQEASR